jgi:ArsR family metal-binding transcriptional regulator
MGRYIRKNPDDEGVRNVGRIEAAVLSAWKRGERTAEEIAEITKLPLKTVYNYIPKGEAG